MMEEDVPSACPLEPAHAVTATVTMDARTPPRSKSSTQAASLTPFANLKMLSSLASPHLKAFNAEQQRQVVQRKKRIFSEEASEDEEEEEEDAMDQYLSKLELQDTKEEGVTGSALLAMDTAKLNAYKDRLWDVSHTLLYMRNECARRSYEDQPWRKPDGSEYTLVARAEIILRVMQRRLFYLLLEAPF
eukprot:m.71182 g.71182  ORF g.71182 m.71182 type:complete len:189 (+) comp7625_c0_seq1:75-641(+)